jgi:hypothetical protein
MDMTEVFQTFYQQCDIKKEIEEHSVILNNDNKGIRMINDEIIEQLIQYLMLKSFAKGSEATMEIMKNITKFDKKSVEL